WIAHRPTHDRCHRRPMTPATTPPVARRRTLATMEETHVLEVEDLTKRYGKTLAVNGVSFRAPAGAVTGFVGPNGAGKTTIMRLILGLDRPTRGTATFDGRPYRRLERPLTQVGAALDPYWFHGGRSARANLRGLALSNGLPDSRVDRVLELTGLTEVA